MALQKTVVFHGITIPNAYIRIMNLSGKDSVGIFVSLHSSKEQEAFDTREYNFAPDWNQPILEQAYTFLKSQPEFEGATDLREP